jgi:O-antigen ligase
MTYTILLVALGAGFATLAWRDFKLALTCLLGLLPAYLLRFSIGPVPSTMLEVFILTLAAAWIMKHKGGRVDLLRSFGAFRSPLLLLLAAASFAVAVAPNAVAALGIWKAYFLEPALVFVMMKATFTATEDWRRALWALGAAGTVIGLGAIAQVVLGVGIPAPWDIELRATSIFDFPNAVGLFTAPLFCAAVVYAVKIAETRKERVIASATAVIMLIGIVLAQTESALIAIPAALLFTFVMSAASKKHKIMAAAGCAVMGLALFVGSTTVQEKLLLHDLSGQVRRSQWSETLAMLADRPVLGAGLAGYPTVFSPYHDSTLYEIFQYPHTLILNVWSELGLIGLLAFGWIALVVLATTWKFRKHPYTLVAFAALAAMTIHGFADVPYFKNDLAVMTWFFLALASSHPSLKRE